MVCNDKKLENANNTITKYYQQESQRDVQVLT